MQYKTIVLELLKGRQALYKELRKARMLLPTMEALAIELKASHHRWIQQLTPMDSHVLLSQPMQITSQAMEPALKELEDRLLSWQAHGEPFSLEQAMAFVKHHMSNA